MIARVKEKTAGKVRSLPISTELRGILESAAKDTDLIVHVVSGGQPPAGTSRQRVGSPRHDVGGGRMGAADVMLFRPNSDAPLKMTIAEERAKMGEFVRRAVTLGAVGVGAGVSYMGASTIHIGGGGAATWGGLKGERAPDWLIVEHAAGMIEGGHNPPKAALPPKKAAAAPAKRPPVKRAPVVKRTPPLKRRR